MRGTMGSAAGAVVGGLMALASWAGGTGCEVAPPDLKTEAVVGHTGQLVQDHAGGSSKHDNGQSDDKDDRRQNTENDGKTVECPRNLPAALNPPADATLVAGLPARGVQIYICTAAATPDAAPAWVLKAPHAVLFQEQEAALIHFAGPSWQALDGSLVTGARFAAAPAPDGTSIPWLLLQAASNVGPGILADVTWIQRLDTVGGAAPATGCDANHLNAQVLLAYRADYFFYRSVTAGKHVHQCSSLN
jgi:hypothetical protein